MKKESEINHNVSDYPKKAPLMNSKEKLICRKVPLVLRYYSPKQGEVSRVICSPCTSSFFSHFIVRKKDLRSGKPSYIFQ